MNDLSNRPQPWSAVLSAAVSAVPSSTAGSVVCFEQPTAAIRPDRREGRQRREHLILRLFFAESWPIRFIAQELNLSQGFVVTVINRAARHPARTAAKASEVTR